jgi:hypothetical protein
MYMPPDPLEIHPAGFIRRRCRNPRCGGKLKRATDKPRDAFCCVGCFDQYYRTVCIVCDRPMRQKGRRRREFCCKRCQSKFHRSPERFLSRWKGAATPLPDAGRNAPRSAHLAGLKTGTKRGGPLARIGPRDWPIDLIGGTDLRLSNPELHRKIRRLIP